MSKKRKRVSLELEQEIDEWKDYLLNDLEERIRNNKGKPLSQRQLKKTTNGDITYERLVKVVGLGNPSRLQQVMEDIAEKAKVESEETDGRKIESMESSAIITPCKMETSQEVSQATDQLKRRKWTKDELLIFLRGKCQELGRVPMQKEIQEWSKGKLCPSYPTCMKVLGASSKVEWDAILLEK